MWLYRGDGAGGFAGARTQIGSGWNARDQVRLVGRLGRQPPGPTSIARDPGTGKLWLYSGDGAGGFRQIRTIGERLADLQPDLLPRRLGRRRPP